MLIIQVINSLNILLIECFSFLRLLLSLCSDKTAYRLIGHWVEKEADDLQQGPRDGIEPGPLLYYAICKKSTFLGLITDSLGL